MVSVRRRLVFSAWADASKRVPFDRVAAARAIADLSPEETVHRHGDDITAVIVQDPGADDRPTRLQLLALRDFADRPLNWMPGIQAEPISIGEDRYTADITHVSIWGNQIAAHDVYRNAPGLSRLSGYLREKADQRAEFRVLYDPTLVEQLKDLEGVRGIQYGLRTPDKVTHAQHRGLFETLLPAAFGPKAPSVTVNLAVGRGAKPDATLDADLSDQLLALAERAGDFFDALHITGKSKTLKTPGGKPATRTINLLSQRLQVERDVQTAAAGGNLPDLDAVADALAAARQQLTVD